MNLLKSFIYAALISATTSSVFGQGTAFTYQGQLNVGGIPANGNYDLRFAIYDLSSGGSQQGGTLNQSED